MGTTTIDHRIRVKLKLNCLEYAVADYLNQSSGCSEHSIMQQIGITRVQVAQVLERLVFLGITDSVFDLIVTDKWKNEFKQKSQPMDKKIQDFKESIICVDKKYPMDMLMDFFNYWSELNASKTKMRWQLEKTWDVSKRLTRWYNNNNKGGAAPVKDKTEYVIK